MPQIFGTITVSDGISMGTEGMKYSLVSREVIADSIETVCGAARVDGLVAIGGCDKNMPGAMIAIARLNIPSIFRLWRHHQAGPLDGENLTIVSAFEAVGEFSAGRIDKAELLEVERHSCPGVGSCGGMFTANTMSSAIEAMGMSLPYSSTMAAEDAEKVQSAAESARTCWHAPSQKQLLPRQIMTRKAFENAISVVMATGGSTNAVLHLLAIARAAERSARRSTISKPSAQRVPVLVRPEAFRQIRRHGIARRRRHSAGHEDPARARRAARRCHDHHAARPSPKTLASRSGRAAQGSGRDSSLEQSRRSARATW